MHFCSAVAWLREKRQSYHTRTRLWITSKLFCRLDGHLEVHKAQSAWTNGTGRFESQRKRDALRILIWIARDSANERSESKLNCVVYAFVHWFLLFIIICLATNFCARFRTTAQLSQFGNWFFVFFRFFHSSYHWYTNDSIIRFDTN